MISVSTSSQCYTFALHHHSCSGATDKNGDTPRDIATQRGYTEIADFLKPLPQQRKLTTIICTVWFNTAILSLYTAAVTEESEENGPPPTKQKGD